jgi:CRP-like cAMP-binding protein
MGDFSEKEERLKQYLQENNTQEAIRILLDLVVAHAKEKDFQKAELFRDRLYDIDAMALSEIIRANEIIIEEKSRGIDNLHKEIWAKLYGMLTTEEGNSLYSAFKEITVYPDEVIFRQGEPCSSLYLVNQGRLSVTSKQGLREILISRLGPGSLFGSETFFSDSLCTTSVTALSTSKLFELDKSALTRWQSHLPAIEPKLKNFCRKEDAIPNLLQQKGMDRRSRMRKKLAGKAAIQFLGNSEELIGKPFRGELCDISSGGISFLFKISSNEKARLILGRRLIIQLRSTTPETPFKIQKKGTVVAVHPSPFDDYSFHIKFDDDLSDRSFKTIVATFPHQDLGLAGNR